MAKYVGRKKAPTILPLAEAIRRWRRDISIALSAMDRRLQKELVKQPTRRKSQPDVEVLDLVFSDGVAYSPAGKFHIYGQLSPALNTTTTTSRPNGRYVLAYTRNEIAAAGNQEYTDTDPHVLVETANIINRRICRQLYHNFYKSKE